MNRSFMAAQKIRQVLFGLALLLICALWLLAARVQASETVAGLDPSRTTGSITMTVRTLDGTAIPGGSFTVYQVAGLVNDNGYHYAYTDAFKDFGTGVLTSKYSDPDNASYIAEDVFPAERVDVAAGSSESNESKNYEMAEALQAYITNNASSVTSQYTMPLGTGENYTNAGSGTLSDLPLGLYLFIQDEPATGYHALSPFLVSVPRLVNGVYEYDVDAYPKPGSPDLIGAVTRACPLISKSVVSSDKKATAVENADLPDGTAFQFLFQALDDSYPMPVNSQGGVKTGGPVVDQDGTQMWLQIDGSGTVKVGDITFTSAGEYYYQVSEVAGKDKEHFDYDSSVYWLKYTVTASEDSSSLVISQVQVREDSAEGDVLYDSEKAADADYEFSFTNKYYEDEPDGDKESESGNGDKEDPKGGSGGSTPSNNPSTGGSSGGGGGSSSGGSGSSLPQTGQLWWPIWILAVAGVVLIISGLILRKRGNSGR